jgi:hypothetical protein
MSDENGGIDKITVKNWKNTGIYREHGEFLIGGKFYLINPARVKNICYDDTPNEEKIILEFNHPDSKLEYYCEDGLQTEWFKLKRDFICFWGTNVRDIEKINKDYMGEAENVVLPEYKTCRAYCPHVNDGKIESGNANRHEAIQNELKKINFFYKSEKQKRKQKFEEQLQKGEISKEEFDEWMEWLEEKYKSFKAYIKEHIQ